MNIKINKFKKGDHVIAIIGYDIYESIVSKITQINNTPVCILDNGMLVNESSLIIYSEHNFLILSNCWFEIKQCEIFIKMYEEIIEQIKNTN